MAIFSRFFEIDDNNPNWTTMYAFSILNSLAYDPDSSAIARWRTAVGGTVSRILRFDDVLLSKVVLIRDDEKAVIAISGTTNGKQLIAQIGMAPVSFGNNFGPLVHVFDYWCARQIQSSLESVLAALPQGADVTIVGHSLGGSVAMVLSILWADSARFRVRALVTFGQPRTGNASFAQQVSWPYVRIIHFGDLVPNYPPRITDVMVAMAALRQKFATAVVYLRVPHYQHVQDAWVIGVSPLERGSDSGIIAGAHAGLRLAFTTLVAINDSIDGQGFGYHHWMSTYKSFIRGIAST
jgi:hypothetical protein